MEPSSDRNVGVGREKNFLLVVLVTRESVCENDKLLAERRFNTDAHEKEDRFLMIQSHNVPLRVNSS